METLVVSSVSVLDCRSHTWREAPSLYPEKKTCHSSATVFDGKIYVVGDPIQDKQNPCRGVRHKNPNMGPCAIDNVLNSYKYGTLEWYDTKVRLWKQVKGLRGVPESVSCRDVRLADYGGKMAVLWDEYEPVTGDKMIWCAVIVVERHKSEEIWGKVEWHDAVLTVPKLTQLESALCATV